MIRPRRSLRSSVQKFSPQNSPSSSHRDDSSNEDLTDEHNIIQEESYEYSNRNVSISSIRTVNHSQEIYESASQRQKALNKAETRKYFQQRNEVEGKLHDRTSACVLVVVFAVCFVVIVFLLMPASLSVKGRKECLQFKELAKDFSNQDKSLWRSLKVGIENVVNQTPPQPSVFLLAYNDAETSKNLMAKILNATAVCMNSQNPIELEGSTFATEAMIKDYGEIIAAYRPRLLNEGIMYVANVHEIPAPAAQAFHAICDTVTPLVEKSVIFLTMYVEPRDREVTPQEIHRLVETQLEKNWIDINHNTLKALIGRVTDQVFLLH